MGNGEGCVAENTLTAHCVRYGTFSVLWAGFSVFSSVFFSDLQCFLFALNMST